jgi:glutamate racemase
MPVNPDAVPEASAPIAVFDSGLGGLTVARAIRARLPAETIAYFGDTARLPYGTKSAQTVHRFARQCLQFMMHLRPKLLVVACNTVSALALAQLKTEFAVPVVGVLEPGAAAAVAAARAKTAQGLANVGLIATEATIASDAYPQAIRRQDRQIHVLARACPLLVPLIEEGREPDDAIVRLVLREYLQPFYTLPVQALILGCTHYPVFASAIAAALPPSVALIDSADATALVVERMLATMPALCPPTQPGGLSCYVTDQGQRFERLASRFLGAPVRGPVWVTPEMLEATGLEA